MRILIQPAGVRASRRNYEKTIQEGIWIEELEKYLTPEQYNILKDLKKSKIQMWGMVLEKGVRGDRKEWIDLRKGDYVLFYAQKTFYYVARICLKVHNSDLARMYWNEDSTGRTWEYIYFINEGKEIDIPYKSEILKTKDGRNYHPNYFFRGAQLLDENNSDILFHYLESYGVLESSGEIINEDSIRPKEADEENFDRSIPYFNSVEEAENKINELSQELLGKPVEERVMIAKVYVRNPKFSKWVKERAKYTCEICGAKPFQKKDGFFYAEAHHKFELAKNRIDDPHFMICVCPTCHRVIHYGNDEALAHRKELGEHH